MWRLAFSILLACSAWADDFLPDCPGARDYSRENLPLVLESWQERIEAAGGVHPWDPRHDGMRVFQEWLTLLHRARDGTPRERRRVGRALESYVVGGDIGPLGLVGTTVPLPGLPRGDFDMTLLGCITLLGLFESDSLLLPNSVYVHLLDKVVRVRGQEPKATFDVLLFSFRESENHIFMTESVRYLANQFLWKNPRQLAEIGRLRDSLSLAGVILDNHKGPVHRFLLQSMHTVLRNGLFEFNAQIYQRFTLHALDNLYSFAVDSAIVLGAQATLDYVATKFVFQSIGCLRYGPFRRSAEIYRDTTLVFRDAATSFFAVQALDYRAYERGPKRWLGYTPHASMALYSSLLRYRLPIALLRHMHCPDGPLQVDTKTRFEVGGESHVSEELYFRFPNFLVSSGGRYQSFPGANFPAPGRWFLEAPWVYDVISRSSNVIFMPDSTYYPHSRKDLIHFRGPQWRAHNTAVHRNFLFGYVETPVPGEHWPQWIPFNKELPTVTKTLEHMDLRFVDVAGRGVYLVLGRLHTRGGLLPWLRDDVQRGFVEVIDTSWASGFDEVVARVTNWNADLARRGFFANRYPYQSYAGHLYQLNGTYGDGEPGILEMRWGTALDSQSEPGVLTQGEKSLEQAILVVRQFRMNTALPGSVLAIADGTGRLQVRDPSGIPCLSVNFRKWWHPEREDVCTGS